MGQTWYDPTTDITYITTPTSYTPVDTSTTITTSPVSQWQHTTSAYWQVRSFGLSKLALDSVLVELCKFVSEVMARYSARITIQVTDLDLIAIRKMLKLIEPYKITSPDFGIRTEHGRKRVYLIIHNLFDSGVADYIVDVTQNLVTEFDSLDGIEKFNFDKVYKSFPSLCKYLKKEGHESWKFSLTDLEKSLSPYKVVKTGKTDLTKKEVHLDCRQGMVFMDETTYKFLCNQAKWDGFKTNLAALLLSDDGEIAEAAAKVAGKLLS